MAKENTRFKDFFKQDAVYIHSNARNFNKIINEQNINQASFQDILKNIKTNLVNIIMEDVNFFRKIEDYIVKDMIEKWKGEGKIAPFTDRKSYLNYLEEFRNDVTKNQSTGFKAYSFIQFKVKNIESDKMIEKIFTIMKKMVPQTTALEKKRVSLGKKANDDSKFISLQKTAKNITNLDAKTKANIKKDVDKIMAKYKTEMKNLADSLGPLFASAIFDAQVLLDPQRSSGSSKESKKELSSEMANAEKKLLTLLGTFNISNEEKDGTRKTKEQLAIEIKKISDLDPFRFLSTFYNMVARDYITHSVDSIQLHSNLGFLFEPAVADAIITNALKKDSNFPFLVFDSKAVTGVGQVSWLRSNSPMDLKMISVNRNSQPIHVGMSIKLKDKSSAISLAETPSEKYWDSLKKQLSGTEDNLDEYEYLRMNIIALSAFSEKGDPDIKMDLNKFAEFEKELLSISMISRLLVGFYEKIDEQIRTVGERAEGEPKNDLYYTAYIYGLDSIMSTADVLEGVLRKLDEPKKLFSVTFKDEKNPTVGEDKLRDLWEKKKNAMEKMKKVSYSSLFSDSDVLSLITEINNTALRYSMQGSKALVEMTPTQMEDALKTKI